MTAANDGGPRTEERTISWTPLPGTVVLEKLVARGGNAQSFPLQWQDGRWFVPQVPTGKLVLYGSIVWPEGAHLGPKQPLRVRVWVNGFQQVPSLFLPAPAGGAAEALRGRSAG